MGCCCIKNIKDVDDNDENMGDSAVLMTYNDQALSLKEKGKSLNWYRKWTFQRKSLSESDSMLFISFGMIDSIKRKSPNELVYHTNLAQAYRANGQF